MTKFSPSARKKARVLTLQALYQWSLTDEQLTAVEQQFIEHNDMAKVDAEYFHELLFTIPKQLEQLDEAITPFLDRAMKDLTRIERIVLRIASYELMYRLDVPYRVVINEAVELAKGFGATDGHKYVNGVLDKLAAKLRSTEINS